MPYMNGYEVAQKLREINPRQFIVSLSGSDVNNPLFDKSVEKPVKRENFQEIISEYEEKLKINDDLIDNEIVNTLLVLDKDNIVNALQYWLDSVKKFDLQFHELLKNRNYFEIQKTAF